MPRRLKLDQIERKPKKVFEAKSWRIRVDFAKKPELASALVAIRRAIIEGKALPKGSYRSGLGLTRDELLVKHGIMHLHLGHAGTREVLYLVQYPDYVIFLEVSDHVHLDTRPPGQMLLRDHRARLEATARAIDEGTERDRLQNVSELRKRLKGLLRKKDDD